MNPTPTSPSATINVPPNDPNAQLRWGVYLLLIVLSAGMMFGRILAVDSIDKKMAEDIRLKQVPAELEKRKADLEARGVTGDKLARALAETEAKLQQQAVLCRPFLSANDRSRWCTVRALIEDDMRVEGVPYAIDKVIQQPNWDTIDMVKHNDHLYSSKPPLLATVMAGVYWPIYRFGGVTLATHPYEIDRFMLVLFNVMPLVVCFVLLAALVERFGATDWGRIFVMAAAAFATFLTTFSVVINNHVPAAVCVLIAVFATVRIICDGERRLRFFVISGLFAALAVTCELPSVAFAAVVAIVLLWRAPRQTLLVFTPTALLIAAAFFGTNWLAVGTWEPAYSHRADTNGDWYDYTYERNGREIESYWRHPAGVDVGEPSQSMYVLHVLVGHHGIFSLTPIWLLSVVGAMIGIWRPYDPRFRWIAAGILVISLACVTFYVMQPQLNRNYGGLTSGLRWVFWFAPLWLLAMLPAVDAMASRMWTRGLALILLAASALSVSFPTWNPWTHPWLMKYLQYLGVVA
jgi:hypothetical protein